MGSNYETGDYTKDSNIMTIKAYLKDPLVHGRSISTKFDVRINPESFTHNRSITFNSEKVANSAHDVYQFQGYGKETVSFSLVLDGTGYVNKNAESVNSQLNELLNVVYNYQSSSHKSHYNELQWGQFNFDCHCEKLDVNYTLFDTSGNGLIAEVDLTFVVHRNKKKAMMGGQPQSPDMTHIHTFKDGDNLLAICKEIYDDTSYYIQIAELNGLSNFRKIPVGKQLIFPPLVNKD